MPRWFVPELLVPGWFVSRRLVSRQLMPGRFMPGNLLRMTGQSQRIISRRKRWRTMAKGLVLAWGEGVCFRFDSHRSAVLLSNHFPLPFPLYPITLAFTFALQLSLLQLHLLPLGAEFRLWWLHVLCGGDMSLLSKLLSNILWRDRLFCPWQCNTLSLLPVSIMKREWVRGRSQRSSTRRHDRGWWLRNCWLLLYL
jgi:hypothetical protein